MKRYLLIPLILFSLSAYSAEWVSPIDKNYSNKFPVEFLKFSKARELLNAWRGQGERLAEADALLRQILEKEGSFAPAYREYGRLFMMAGHINYDNFREGSLNPAEQVILKSLEIEPDYADSYVLLGHLYTKMRRYKEAESALDKAEKIGTKIPWLQLNWADLLSSQEKYEEAMRRYQYIIEVGTSNRKAYSSALSGVTTMYWYMEQYDKADEGHKKEIEYEPDNAWKWGSYSSFLLFTRHDVDGAIEKGRKAISIMNYGMGRFTLACALYTKWAQMLQEQNMKEQAMQYFDQAWSLFPYPEKIIEKTRNYKYTTITAIELQKWVTKQ